MGSIYAKHKGRVFLIYLLFLIVGILIFSSLQSEVEQEMVNWPTTTGTITESSYSLTYDEDDDGRTTDTDYDIHIEYRYVVDGVEYTSTRISISQYEYGEVDERGEAEAILFKYDEGTEVIVTYHPTVHSFSILEYNPDSNPITNDGIIWFFSLTTLLLLYLGFPIFKKEMLFFKEGQKQSHLSVESIISDLPENSRKLFGVKKDGLKGSIENFFGMDKNDVPEGVKYGLIFLLMISGVILWYGQNVVATAAILFRFNWLLYFVSSPLLIVYLVLSFIFSWFVLYKSINPMRKDEKMSNGGILVISFILLIFVGLGGMAFTFIIAPMLIGLFFYIAMAFYMPVYLISTLLNNPITGISARYFALLFFIASNIFVLWRLPKYEITRRKGQIMVYTRDPIYYRYITEPKSEERVDYDDDGDKLIEISLND